MPTKNSHLHKIVTILAETSFKLLQDVPLTAISDFMPAFIVTRSTLDLNYFIIIIIIVLVAVSELQLKKLKLKILELLLPKHGLT